MAARVPQAGALPDPTFASGVINEGRAVPLDTLGEKDFSEVYFGLAQDVPFPGKRALREQVAREEAAAEGFAYERARRELAVAVAQAYYDVYAAQSALEIVERDLASMDQLVELARGRVAVGQGVQQDIFEAEVERSRLEERRGLLEQELRALEAGVARLLDREAVPHWDRLAPPVPTPLAESVDALVAAAEQASPVLGELRDQVEAAERRLDLARRDLLPDLSFELVYHNRGKQDLDPFYTAGWTVTLPVYADRKQRRAIEQAAAELAAARSRTRGARADLRLGVQDACLRARTAQRILRLYDEGLLAQARLALDSALAQYEVGRVDFQAVLSSRRSLLESQIAYHAHVAAHQKAVARLALHLGSSAAVPF